MRIIDFDICAEPKRLWHWHPCLANRTDESVFALHIVGRCEDLPHRWPAQNKLGAVCINNFEGQVRTTASDQREIKRCLRPFDVGLKPTAHILNVDTAHRDNGRRSRTVACQPGRAAPETLRQVTAETFT